MNSDFYPQSNQPEIVTIPPAQFITIESGGSPDKFLDYASILRGVIEELGQKAGPLEALWWTSDGGEMAPDMANWRWMVMLKLEKEITDYELNQAVGRLKKHKNDIINENITLETYNEGEVVQLLYTGSLKNKEPEMQLLKDFAAKKGYSFIGKYHEIYFDDPGPGSPPDAKTILRQQIKKISV